MFFIFLSSTAERDPDCRTDRPRKSDDTHIWILYVVFYHTLFILFSAHIVTSIDINTYFFIRKQNGEMGDKEKKTWTPFTRTILNLHSSSKLPSKHSLSGICNGARLYTHFSLESLRRGIVLVLAYQLSSVQFLAVLNPSILRFPGGVE